MKVKKSLVQAVLCAVWVGSGPALEAADLGINLLGARHATYVCGITNEDEFVSTPGADFSLWTPGLSRLLVANHELSDAIYYFDSGILLARAAATPFGVTAHSDGRSLYGELGIPLHHAAAGAKTEITFSPVTSGAGLLDFGFAGYDRWYYSQGAISLVDVTAAATIWEFGWDREHTTAPYPWKDGRVEWELNPERGEGEPHALARLALNTTFDADRIYSLVLQTQTFSDWDEGTISIELNGLTIVPEPSVLVLAGCGAGALLAARRRAIRSR